MAKAKALEAEYERLNFRDDQFDMSDAFLSIAIALAAVAALVDAFWLLCVAWGSGAFGILVGGAGFLGYSLRPEWIAIRPNTDTAIMLGLAHTLVELDLHDRAFLARYTVGFERFRSYLMGETGLLSHDTQIARAIRLVAAALMLGAAVWGLRRAGGAPAAEA